MQKLFDLFFVAETHHPLNPGPVVPTTIKDDDLARRRQMRQVALDIHLAFLAVARGWQCHNAEYTRADPFGNRLDRAPLAGGVAAFKDNDNLLAGVHDPFLQLDQFDMHFLQFSVVHLAAQLAVFGQFGA